MLVSEITFFFVRRNGKVDGFSSEIASYLLMDWDFWGEFTVFEGIISFLECIFTYVVLL